MAKLVISAEKDGNSPSIPAVPVAVKRKRRLVDEDEEEEEVEMECNRRIARKLKDEFDLVAVDRERFRSERDSVEEGCVVEKGNRGGGVGRRLVKGFKVGEGEVQGRSFGPRGEMAGALPSKLHLHMCSW